MSIFEKIFGNSNGRYLDSLKPIVEEINGLEEKLGALSDADLKNLTSKFKSRLPATGNNSPEQKKFLDSLLPEAFAAVREAAKRTLGQRPFDVQLLGGIVLHQGAVAEMVTGEGKTLAAVAPAYLNALLGRGVHIVTVNEYLARRDAVWMGQIYNALGMSVACLVPNAAYLYDPQWRISEDAQKLIDRERDTTGSFLVQQEFLQPISRREAYQADITYGTNYEFGFDYLRDNLVQRLEEQTQNSPASVNPASEAASAKEAATAGSPAFALRATAGRHFFAIIDEVDSILIDEARTPLIISAPDRESSEFYKTFSRIAGRLQNDEDYLVDEKLKVVSITEAGIEKVEKLLGVSNLYAPENLRLVHFLEESLKAKTLFQRDKDYVVKPARHASLSEGGGNNEVIIVDEFTGRLLHGRRYSGGLHQAIEAKEGVRVQEESRTYAKISIQNYFRLYEKISGMTGTAQTSAEEFHKVYNLEVVSVPTNKPLIREDLSDVIYKTEEAKWRAIVDEIKERRARGQPLLVGTTSIERNEILSAMLRRENVSHEVLNAKNNEREGAIIAQAGKLGGVTVATNMAGRGVDIILGGNPEDPEAAQKVRELGGLHVIGTERHEARRIDNQLRGRAGRQGDPGSSRFFLSLEDDLLRIFGGEKIKNMMESFNLPEDQPIEAKIVSRAVAQAQAKVEGFNFDLRKRLLEYDDVLNKQRTAIYKRRQEILGCLDKKSLSAIVFEAVKSHLEKTSNNAERLGRELPQAELKKLFEEAGIIDKNFQSEIFNFQTAKELLERQSQEAAADPQIKNHLLVILDLLWMNQLEDLEALSESVNLRAYGQKDPLVEYRHEAHRLFQGFWDNFNEWVFMNIFRLARTSTNGEDAKQRENVSQGFAVKPSDSQGFAPTVKVGRNDPCPCGAKREDGRPIKYKHCHGKNA